MSTDSDTLRTRNIFLDTQVFDAETFFVGTTKLAQLRKLAAEGKIHLVMPQITIDECKNRIRKLVIEARDFLHQNKTKRSVAILRNSPSVAMSFKELDVQKIAGEIAESFEAFLKDAKAEIVPIGSVTPEKLFGDYFNCKPPFGDKQEKEFLDAAALLSLNNWCEAKSQSVYVVSADGHHKSSCEANSRFIFKEKVLEFLDIFNQHEKGLVEIVNRILVEKKSTIEEKVREKFEESGFDLRGEIGDVENVKVTEIEDEGTYVISVDDDWAIAETQMLLKFSADISYRDYAKGMGDSTTWDFSHISITEDQRISAEIEIEYGKHPPQDSTVNVSMKGDFEIFYADCRPDHWGK